MISGLTPTELERAIVTLQRLRNVNAGPWELRHVKKVWFSRGRPPRSMLTALTRLGILHHDDRDRWTLSGVGAHILAEHDDQNWRPLTVLMMRAGGLEDEVVAFLHEARDTDGHAVLGAARARTVCPTLAAVMGWVPEWRVNDDFSVPLEALEAAMAAAALEIATTRPAWIEDREEVGLRAEAYSLRRERELHGAAAIIYVARDVGDRFGYDIEDRGQEPARLIECKGSRSADLRFVISSHELEIAREKPGAYEVQYWAEIDLGRNPQDEYRALVQAGYPIVINDLAARIEREELARECVAWSISEPAGQTA